MQTRAERVRDLHLASLMSEISAIMKRKNITQAELARRACMNPSAINNVLSLKVDPRASTLVVILKALDQTLTMEPNQESIAP
jgi:transcriptional regulator with XRE-family HTH domain